MSKYWYRVDVMNMDAKPRPFCGSSSLDYDQLMKALATDAYLRLDDLFFRDSQNRFKPWSEWEPRLAPTIFINPKHVVAVMPFDGDPRSTDSSQ